MENIIDYIESVCKQYTKNYRMTDFEKEFTIELLKDPEKYVYTSKDTIYTESYPITDGEIGDNTVIFLNMVSKNKDNVDWLEVSKFKYLPERFIREFQDMVDWDTIFWYQTYLSTDFIREFQDKVTNWDFILLQQLEIDDDFIREFFDKFYSFYTLIISSEDKPHISKELLEELQSVK